MRAYEAPLSVAEVKLRSAVSIVDLMMALSDHKGMDGIRPDSLRDALIHTNELLADALLCIENARARPKAKTAGK